MADDERRAEIEAVAEVLAWEFGISERPSQRIIEAAAKCVDQLDRLRDARGDDEAGPRGVARAVEAVRTGGLSERRAERRDARGDDEERPDDYKRRAVALPLATTNANCCEHRRENGHRCALPVGHASEHFYREDGVPWRGDYRRPGGEPMTLNDVKKLRDQIARLPRETPFRDRPYEAYVRLTDVLALLKEEKKA